MIQPETREMFTRDGVRLDADVYYPDVLKDQVLGEYPVLLMRQPYGRAIASTVVYAHPSWYAAQGYIVVIQDVRGRGTSCGTFKLFESEIEDGYDAVMWASTLPHSNGKVGMYGFSYQGMTQIYAMMHRPPALKALCPAMLAHDLYEDWAYEGDVFRLQSNLSWALQIAAEGARLSQDHSAFLTLKQAAKHLPLSDKIPAYPEILTTVTPDSFYHDWIRREPWDAYGSYPQMDLEDNVCTYGVGTYGVPPMLHIGGWFDPYLTGTLKLHARYPNEAPQHLIIGPWAHLPWGRRAGSIDFGPDAVSDCDRAQVRWFDYWLKGEGTLDAAATWFEMGTNRWVNGDRFEDLATQSWQLETTGLTSMSDGRLVKHPSPLPPAVPDIIVHDPWRPVPSLGGHAASRAGVFDRSHLDDRADVLTYTTEPFSEPLLIQGKATAQIQFKTSSHSVDFHVVLSQVFPDGTVFNICQGVKKVIDAESDRACMIHLQSTSVQIPTGSRLRVSVSLSNYPAYAMNSGTGKPLHEEPAIDYQIITAYITGGTIFLPIGH